jgi:hypothetical protein
MTKWEFLEAAKNCIERLNNRMKAVRISDILTEYLFRDQPIRQ